MRTLGIIFYTTVLIIIGLSMMVSAVAFSFAKLQPQCVQFINDILYLFQGNFYYKVILFLSGLLLILLSFFFAQLILSKFAREKTIAFATSTGEVTIALSAIEDLIRRLAGYIPEIKELRPDVIAGKKGILVDLRITLKSEANIPELTARLQDITRAKIQEVLGIEEQIIVKIHVAKIISQEERDRKKREIEKEQPSVPFGGYGRV